MLVAPSVLTCDFKKLGDEIKRIVDADYIHLDIMDGHFVPNISFGPHIAKQISNLTDQPLDVHLMVTDPIKWIDSFHFSNTKFITIHVEANDVDQCLKYIREKQIKTGISIKPNTDVSKIKPYLKDIDLVLVMTVEPGFGGQSFKKEMMKKVEELKNDREKNHYHFIIEVDGGINDQTIDVCKKSGVDMVVAGSYVFNHENSKKAILSLK